jgi:hypothetical protein
MGKACKNINSAAPLPIKRVPKLVSVKKFIVRNIPVEVPESRLTQGTTKSGVNVLD